jgi:hypothetical protein
MERFWKAALGVAGVGAVAFFVFYSLYKQWLKLPIFPQLTQAQAYDLMRMFLLLTFVALIAGLVAWLWPRRRTESGDEALHRLEEAWKGVNYIDCDNLVGPDVAKAANALQITATYWRNGFITKNLLFEHHGATFIEIYEQLNSCDKQVPGYSKPVKKCGDFLPAVVRSTYKEIKDYASTSTSRG